MGKFELYKDKKGETRFRYRSKNGEVMFSSEAYKAKASALKSIDFLKKNIAAAPVEDVATAPAAKKAPAKGAAAGKPAAKTGAKPATKTAPKATTARKTAAKAATGPKSAVAKKAKVTA